MTRKTRGRRSFWVTVEVLLLMLAAITAFLWWRLETVVTEDVVTMPTPVVVTSTASSEPSTGSQPEATLTPSVCNKGASAPKQVTIKKLKLDASVEKLAPTDGSIGDPKNKANLGWYPKWPGVKPCAGKGAVLMSGHTYHDNSAVFKESLKDTNTIGYVVDVELKNGGHRLYKITKQVTVKNEKFSSYVIQNDLYDKDRKRRETLVIMTCSTWNGSAHLTETILVAEPIN